MLTAVEPRVSFLTVDCRAHGKSGRRWLATWVLRNDDAQQLHLEMAWIPHGRFRGDGRFGLDAIVNAGDSTRLEFPVTAQEAPETVVENAFLILRVRSQGRGWRIFTRMRVEFDAQAVPRPRVEVVTLQSIE